MKAGSRFLAALVFVLLLLGVGVDAHARVYGWEFSSEADLRGWQVGPAYIRAGNLVVRSERSVIVSRPGLNIPASADVLWLRFKAPTGGVGAVGLISPVDGKISSKMFTVERSPVYRDYKVHIGGLLLPGVHAIEMFVIQLPVSTSAYTEIDFVRFYEPSALETAALLWRGFWDTEFINTRASTIFSVKTPKVSRLFFIPLLYLLMAALAAGIIAVSAVRRRTITGALVARAVFISFLVGATLFTIRMDYNWLAMWRDDARLLYGKDVRGRISTLFSVFEEDFERFLGFVDFIKGSLPEGATVRPATKPDVMTREIHAKYFLLPVRTSKSARYLWVYDGARFDPATRSLMKGAKVVASPVRLFAEYGEGAAIYEIEKGDGS